MDAAVDGMLDEWRLVEEGGKSLKGACEQLLEERVRDHLRQCMRHTDLPQDHLLSITDAIGERLGYFQELEHATRMLNHPGDSLVLQTEFLYMVERVDVCIEYLKTHVSLQVSLPIHRLTSNSGISVKQRSTYFVSSSA